MHVDYGKASHHQGGAIVMLTVKRNPIFAPPPEQEQRELKQRTTLARRTAKRTMVSALQSRNAIKEINVLPDHEETLHVICRGNFPLWQIIPAILQMAAPATITELSIATLGFSTGNAIDLLNLIDAGQIGTTAIVASVYFERQNPSEYRLMAEGLSERGHRIVAIRSHAKVIAIELSDGRQFAIESSANLRSCRNIEQLSFTQSRELYQFHRAWMNEVIDASTSKAGTP